MEFKRIRSGHYEWESSKFEAWIDRVTLVGGGTSWHWMIFDAGTIVREGNAGSLSEARTATTTALKGLVSK